MQILNSIAKLFLYEILDALIQAVMFCGQDKSKKTILMEDQSIDDISTITRFLANCLDEEAQRDFRSQIWRSFTNNGISRGEGQTKIYFKPVSTSN